MLFKDTTKLKEYSEFTDINFFSVKPTIRQVEEGELTAIIGKELYDSLNTAYTAAATEDSLSASQKALLDKCRMLIAPYVIYHYTPKADVSLSDAGARRNETSTSKTAYNYQVLAFREQKLKEGEAAAESLLQFLEDNKEDYELWVNSDAFAEQRSVFIKSGKEFARFFRTNSPYRNYYAFRSKMVDIEEQVIKPAISTPFYTHLKTADTAANGTFTVAEAQLMYIIKKAIANFTVASALPFHAVRIDENGLTVVANTTNYSPAGEGGRALASDSALQHIIRHANDSGKVWLKQAVDYIMSNPILFPLYVAVVPVSLFSNETARGSFGMY